MSTDVRAEDAGRWHNWPPENIIAWERACKETREAWRSPPQQSYLAILIRSDVPTKEIAALLHRLNAPLPEGKPGGAHTRWLRPHYLVALPHTSAQLIKLGGFNRVKAQPILRPSGTARTS